MAPGQGTPLGFVLQCSCSGIVPTLSVDDYERNLRNVLEEMRKNISKLFVNLVQIGNISEVSYWGKELKCKNILHFYYIADFVHTLMLQFTDVFWTCQ